MSVKTLKIDGEMVTGRAGETLFNVAWDAGISLPRLCHVGGLSDVGACRLCVVEVEGQSKLAAACVTPVEEGMVVHTNTERLREHRRLLIELLFAEGNHVCSVCVSNGHCELQDLAVQLGVDHVRLRYQHPKRGVDATHARFGLDHNRCIFCTRCVRVCDEVEGAHTLDVSGRGASLKIICDLGEPWGQSETCTSCGKCVQVCPTGALYLDGASVGEMEKNRRFLQYIVTAREKREWIRKG
ncbi:MAG: bidirectional hydrogenase complex protein HoxU [Deltaproteobacteria bacterium]|nr:bidirectional hydrogenase complex protein HoxU [Deltaproteobacteria bacterium]